MILISILLIGDVTFGQQDSIPLENPEIRNPVYLLIELGDSSVYEGELLLTNDTTLCITSGESYEKSALNIKYNDIKYITFVYSEMVARTTMGRCCTGAGLSGLAFFTLMTELEIYDIFGFIIVGTIGGSVFGITTLLYTLDGLVSSTREVNKPIHYPSLSNDLKQYLKGQIARVAKYKEMPGNYLIVSVKLKADLNDYKTSDYRDIMVEQEYGNEIDFDYITKRAGVGQGNKLKRFKLSCGHNLSYEFLTDQIETYFDKNSFTGGDMGVACVSLHDKYGDFYSIGTEIYFLERFSGGLRILMPAGCKVSSSEKDYDWEEEEPIRIDMKYRMSRYYLFVNYDVLELPIYRPGSKYLLRLGAGLNYTQAFARIGC
ncbi:hypothetical protein JXI42_09240 [bacterium]|nr:hypothetical protein [bacterium]